MQYALNTRVETMRYKNLQIIIHFIITSLNIDAKLNQYVSDGVIIHNKHIIYFVQEIIFTTLACQKICGYSKGSLF